MYEWLSGTLKQETLSKLAYWGLTVLWSDLAFIYFLNWFIFKYKRS